MKKTSDFSRLMGYAGRYRVFTYASWVLSAISALTALVPFLYIWMILRDVLAAAPDYAQAVNIPHYGWMAVLFAVLSYLIYIAALMCSHLSAFRVATNLRLAVSEHLAVLPLGFAENFGSGKLRKIIHESTGAAETYLAHQLPDQYNAIATPVGLLVLLLAFDWRLGLLSLAPVVLAFLIMATMTGKRMVEKMRQYGNALEAMSNEAVEYVRGIPVVKTFGQSVFSFKKFKTAIDEYEKWVVSYLYMITGTCFTFLPACILSNANTIFGVRSKKPISLFQLSPHLQWNRPINCCFIFRPQLGQTRLLLISVPPSGWWKRPHRKCHTAGANLAHAPPRLG